MGCPTSVERAFDAASDMVFVTDDTPRSAGGPRIEYANRAMLTELGVQMDDIRGRTPDFAVGPRTDSSVLSEIRDALSVSLNAGGEILIYRADGSSFWSDWRIHQFTDGDDGHAKWLSIGRNTDTRRRLESERAMIATAIDHATDAVYVYGIRAGDSAPRVRYVNAAGIASSYSSREEFADGDGGDEVLREMRAGRPLLKRMRLDRKDGSPYWANLSFQPIRDRRGDFSQWVCIERDITDMVEREEVRTELMAMIGHDLRNPLTNILGFTELLLEQLGPEEATYDAIRQIRVSARRLESLAAEMVTVALLERDEYRPQLEIIDVGALLLDVLTYFADRDRIDVTITGPVNIRADPAGVRHVIENLLSNAAKFSNARVSADVVWLESAAVLRVRDHGIGIPEADLPRIFDRATRAGNVGKRKGTGLGLSFAKHLVELAGGTIQLGSVEGVGTTVEVFFAPLSGGLA